MAPRCRRQTRGLLYMAGFAISTAALHSDGIAAALALGRAGLRPLVRLAGAACVVAGIAMILDSRLRRA